MPHESDPLPDASAESLAAFSAQEHAAQVQCKNCEPRPLPWQHWERVDFHDCVKEPLLAAGFPSPSAIQQYVWPVASAGRDVIGIARTGSGKTLAFLMPIFSSWRAEQCGPGPAPAVLVALVLAPTRELACQIEAVARQFGAPAGLCVAAVYGGVPKGPQLGSLRRRPHLVVATPGRLIDFLEPPPGIQSPLALGGVRFLVVDEADRLLDMGFEPQIRRIIERVPLQRQTMMFTATWLQEVRELAADFLRDPVEVHVGGGGEVEACGDVQQHVELFADVWRKEQRLEALLEEFRGQPAIVFVNTKRNCERVAGALPGSVAIHGDRMQDERDASLAAFRAGRATTLVATDVAARGLDIQGVKVVINFECPRREEDYVHRIGRTGRAGQKGLAFSLLTDEDGPAAQSIADILRRSGLEVPQSLQDRLASGRMKFPLSRDPRDRRERAKRRASKNWLARGGVMLAVALAVVLVALYRYRTSTEDTEGAECRSPAAAAADPAVTAASSA